MASHPGMTCCKCEISIDSAYDADRSASTTRTIHGSIVFLRRRSTTVQGHSQTQHTAVQPIPTRTVPRADVVAGPFNGISSRLEAQRDGTSLPFGAAKSSLTPRIIAVYILLYLDLVRFQRRASGSFVCEIYLCQSFDMVMVPAGCLAFRSDLAPRHAHLIETTTTVRKCKICTVWTDSMNASRSIRPFALPAISALHARTRRLCPSFAGTSARI